MFKPTPRKPVLYEFVFCAKKALKGLFDASLSRIHLLKGMYEFVSKRFIALAGIFVLSFALWSVAHFTGVAHAATPTLNFQARLESNTGGIAPDGYYNVEFKLYEGGTESGGGTLKWTETRKFDGGPDNRVRVANGYLTVNLGSVTNFPGTINWDDDLYLTMNIGGTTTGAPSWDGEMNPRLKLTSVPYAFQAQSATQLEVKQGVNTGTLGFDTLTTNRNILLPDADGTVCLQNSADCGFTMAGDSSFIQNTGGSLTPQAAANFNIQATDNGTTGTIAGILRGAAGGQTADLFQLQAANGTVLTAFTASGNLKVASSIDTYTGTTLSVGTANATGITIAQPGVTTTVNGALTVGQLLTGQAGLTVTGAAVNLNASSNFDTNLNTGTSTGAVNIGNSLAGTISLQSGNTIQLISGASMSLTSTGANNINLYPGGGSNTGVLIKPTTDTNAALQIQNAAGTASVLTVDTTNSQVILGTSNVVSGKLVFKNSGDGNSITLTAPTNTSASYSLILPSTTPSTGLCVATSNTNANQLVFTSCFQQVSNAPITHAGNWSASGTNTTSVSVSPVNPGDLMVIAIGFQNNQTITNITGGGVSSWQPITTGHSGTGAQKSVEMWRGVVTSTGSSTITITYSGASGTTDIAVDEYSMGSAFGTWSVDSSGVQFNNANSVVTYPSLTPQSNNELYTGYGFVQNAPASAGSTPGFTYRTTSAGVVAYSTSSTSGVAVQPTATQASSGNSYTIAATILAFSNNNVIVNSTNQQDGNFNVRGSTAGNITAVLQAATSGSGDILNLRNGSGTNVATFGSTGAALFKNSTNSTTAFQVQNASGASIFNVDTTNAKIGTRNETAASTNSAVLTVKSGDASGTTSNSGNVVIGSGDATGTSGNVTIDVGTGATKGSVSLGGTNAGSVTIGHSGVQTEIKGDTKVTLNGTTSTGMVCQNTTTGVLSACDSSYKAPTATNFIQNQNVSAQTAANFWIDGTGHANTLQADTAVQTPKLDTATATALAIGTTNATNITLGHNAGTLGIDATNFDLSTAGVVTLAGGQAIDLSSNGATNLTIDTGGAATLKLGTANATAVTISRTGVATTIQGTLTVSEAATFNGTAQFNQNVTVAAGKTLKITGGTTNSVAPTAEGQLYFDTDTNQLLVAFQNPDTGSYQWKASSQEAILVAANNSSAADKQAADYVADGTADQTEINYALTKGAGKKVLLLPGTYVASGTILVPDNTVLAGTNRNTTIVQLSVGSGTDNLIENATGFGHTNITIQDMTLDGSLGTGGTQQGIYLHDGDVTNRSSVKNVKFTGWAYGSSLALSGAYLDTVSGSVLGNVSIATTQIKNFANNTLNDVSITSTSTIANFANNVLNNVSLDASSIDAFTGNDLNGMTLSNSASITALTGNSLTGALTLSSSASVVDVTGNNIGGGVTMTGSSTLGLISGNAVGRISITNSSVLNIVGNNIIYAGTDNGIKLVNADGVKITDNKIVRVSGTAAAISIDAASDGTFLADNTTGAAAISDSGTNTIYSGQNDGSTYKIQPADDFTITGTAASTISTTAGDLTLQGGSGDVSLGTSTKLKANGALNITSGGANALGLDTGGGAAINIGGTNATSIVLGRAGGGTIRVGQNGGTVQIDGTNFDVSTLGVVTLAGGQTTDIITAGATTLKVDTGGAAAISIGTTNATNITIGHNGGTFAVDGTNFDVSTAGVITLPGGQTNDIVTAGATTLKLDTGGSAALSLGSANASSINIGNSSATTVTIQAAAGAGNGVAVQSSSATSFRVQSSGGASTLLTADATANRRVTVGTVGTLYGTSTANGDLVVVGNTELQGRLYIGNSANDAIYTSSAGGPLRFKGTARNDVTVTLTPEFPGATLNGAGIGTMTSDFCSNSALVLNTSVCTTSGDVHNYYEWSNTTQPTAQAYDVYVRWQVPSNADGSSLSNFSMSAYGWRKTSSDSVQVSVYDASGAVCATSVNVANTNTAWTTASLGLTSCTLTAGSTITFKVHMTASQNNTARAGEIVINYKTLF